MLRVTAVLAALGFSVSLFAPAPAAAQDVALDFTYASAYYWRGAPAGAGNGFVQPSADISYAVMPDLTVGLNLWMSQGPEASDAEDAANSEIDYTVYAAYSAGDIGVYAGAIDYVIPAGAPFADGHVLEAHVGVDFTAGDLGLGVAAALNLDGDTYMDKADVEQTRNSMYIAPSLSYPLGNLSLGLSLGIGNGVYTVDEDEDEDTMALVDITPSVSYSIPLGDEAEAAVGLAIGYNPDTGATLPFLTLGTGWSWSP